MVAKTFKVFNCFTSPFFRLINGNNLRNIMSIKTQKPTNLNYVLTFEREHLMACFGTSQNIEGIGIKNVCGTVAYSP